MNFKFSTINIFLLLIAMLTFISCGEDDMNPSTGEAEMTCLIDGVLWTALEPTASIMNNRTGVSGVSTDSIGITLTLDGDGTATYSFNPNLPNALALTESLDGSIPAYASNQNDQNSNFGQAIISVIDTVNKVLSGTFETEAHRQIDSQVKIITQGVFTDVPYTETLAPTTSTLSAKIDGSDWDAVNVSGFIAFGDLTLNAVDAGGNQAIGFTLPEDIAAGNYMLETPGFGDYGAQYNIDTNTFLGADSGTLIITEHNLTSKFISGTFNFEASELLGSNTASITEGTFEINY